MAYAHLVQTRKLLCKETEVVRIEVVTRIDTKA